MEKLTLKIPATSANLGLGFDSMGLAIDKFLTIEAELNGIEDWTFEFLRPELEQLPAGNSNLVAQTAKKLSRQYGCDMPGLHIKMDSEIPLTHGLGSSSSAIVAGIECANHFCQLGLSLEEKMFAGIEMEGHPDNIGPCFTGGVFVGYYHQREWAYRTLTLDDMALIVSIPHYEMKTIEARNALPDHYEAASAVLQNARNNVMLLSMVDKDYTSMGQLMMEDLFHQPYRGPMIKEYDEIKQLALDSGAYATVISGAGPTLLTLCPPDQVDAIYAAICQVPNCQHDQVHVYYHE